MIPFEEGLKKIISYALPRHSERVELLHALNRTLAEDVFSDVSMPPFNKSAMDGYACRHADIKNTLQIIEEVPAGRIPSKTIGTNQCARIMTGAMVPEGADVVIMKEHVKEVGTDQVLFVGKYTGTNICFAGEDVKAGELVIRKGNVISPAHIAILASVGCVNPLVFGLPSVAIFSTGDELVEPGEQPAISKIRNSNGFQLATQTQQLGITPDYLGIVPDDEVAIKDMFEKTLKKYVVIIVSGGVSVGDFDFVPKILKELNVNIPIHGMDVKPGKHLLFGERDQHFIFGMPGNPVSSFVQFEVLVKPFLKAMTGNTTDDTFLHLTLEADFLRKRGDQMLFIPVMITPQGTVVQLEYHGSAHIHAYTKAQGILEIPKDIIELKKGDLVRVRPL